MKNRAAGATFRNAVAVACAIVLSVVVCAEAAAQTAKARYESATAREQQVRARLATASPETPGNVAAQVSQVIASFEAIVRRFPTSGYADNALFQAAGLAEAAYETFQRAEDRDRAVRFYRWLAKEYPSSSLVKRANAQVAALTKPAVVAAASPAPPPTVRTISATVPAATPAASTGRATLTAVHRAVLPDVVRITIELDREVRFTEQRLAGPERVFFDLQNVQLTPDLLDRVLSYPSDIVNKIRLGRHPDRVVRVVLDLQDVAKYSVFTLYSPYRLVIDAERVSARPSTVRAAAPPAPIDGRPVPALDIPRTVIADGPELDEPAPAAAAPVTASLTVGPSDAPDGSAPAALTPVSTAASTPAPAIAAPRTATPGTSAPATVAPSASARGTSTRSTPAPPPPTAPAAPSANAAGGFSMARQLGLGVSRIVIDPGHGGHDPGVLGRGLTEANLVLDVALRLEKLLEKEPGVEVVLTRRTNVYVALEERTEIANRHHADMFLSIHANASRNPEARGIETYFLSFASSPDAEAVAARENSASTREMNQLPNLIKAITLNSKLDESRDLATMVQNALVGTLRKTNKNVPNRGVKKAPFVVLIGAEMPSVLAEISFVSNRQELALLKTNAYKQRIAEALHEAVMKYRRSLKNQVMTALPEQ